MGAFRYYALCTLYRRRALNNFQSVGYNKKVVALAVKKAFNTDALNEWHIVDGDLVHPLTGEVI